MIPLNFPENYRFKFKQDNNQTLIFDFIRGEYYLNTPEEWVRQNTLMFLHQNLGFPKVCLAVEKIIKIGKLNKRADILVYQNSKPYMLVECKAPSVKLSQKTFEQALLYNQLFKAEIVLITNGLQFKACDKNGKVLKEIPAYS